MLEDEDRRAAQHYPPATFQSVLHAPQYFACQYDTQHHPQISQSPEHWQASASFSDAQPARSQYLETRRDLQTVKTEYDEEEWQAMLSQHVDPLNPFVVSSPLVLSVFDCYTLPLRALALRNAQLLPHSARQRITRTGFPPDGAVIPIHEDALNRRTGNIGCFPSFAHFQSFAPHLISYYSHSFSFSCHHSLLSPFHYLPSYFVALLSSALCRIPPIIVTYSFDTDFGTLIKPIHTIDISI